MPVLRAATVAGLAALLVGLVAGPAGAHVEADAEGATQAGFAVITFRVPTESETASTVGLKVQLPPDQPLASLSVKPHPGWTSSGGASSDSVVGAYVLGVLELLAGVAGLALGLAARRRPATVEGSESVRTGVE
jgi:hypothetical protein